MTEINNINFYTIKAGDKIAEINNGKMRFWEYLMVHPHSDRYVLMIDSCSEDAKKVYIETLIKGGYFYDFTLDEIKEKAIEQLESKIQRLKESFNKEE